MSLSVAFQSLTKKRIASAGRDLLRSQLSQRRHASFYNTDLAGLTEEQAEVHIRRHE